MPPTNHSTQPTRSLLSKSRVDWAIEAARRVGAEPVGALGEAGFAKRASAAVQVLLRMPAASARRAAKVIAERKRGAQTALRGPARLVEQPVRHSPRHPGRDLPDEGLCLGAQGAADADDKGEQPQTGCPCRVVGWHGTGLASSKVCSRKRCAAPRDVAVCRCVMKVSPADSHRS
jgi:hypothetical protein